MTDTATPPAAATSSDPPAAAPSGKEAGLPEAELAEFRLADAVVATLRGVIDPCCKDRGISVVDMGLVHTVDVDESGHAEVEIMLTSGWCPFQVDLVAEITEAAEAVGGIANAEVLITLEQVWSPARMDAGARAKLRLLPDPKDAGDRDVYLAANPLPIVSIGSPAAALSPTPNPA